MAYFEGTPQSLAEAVDQLLASRDTIRANFTSIGIANQNADLADLAEASFKVVSGYDAKADKVQPSATNNVALLSEDGNLVDSGKSLTPEGIGADPAGAGVYSSFKRIPENADLNDYTACGYYGCDTAARAATLTNCPTATQFIMIVSLGGGVGNGEAIGTSTWEYRVQTIVVFKGPIYSRAIRSDGSGAIAYYDWQQFARTTDTVDSANKVVAYNDDSAAVQIGWGGSSLDASTLYRLAGYTSDGKIKEATTNAVLSLLGISIGTWTPTVSGAASYSTQKGYYVTIGKMVIISFTIYGIFAGDTTARISVDGCPFSTSNNTSGGGHLSGYTAASNIIFTGWQASANGKFYAVGQETGTTGGNKWGSNAIYQKASGEFSAAGSIAFIMNE